MVLVGISWLLFWILIEPFGVAVNKASLVTALVFVLLGLLVEKPWKL